MENDYNQNTPDLSVFPEPMIPQPENEEPIPPQSTPNTAPAVNGYTVTPAGSYYDRLAEVPLCPPNASPVQPPVAPQPVVRQEKPPVPPKAPKKHNGGLVICCILLSLIIGFGGAVGAICLYRNGMLPFLKSGNTENGALETGESGNTVQKNYVVTETAESVAAAVADIATESVVGIRTTSYVQSFFYGETEQTGEGSGVIYSKDGYIITNYHVVQSANESSGGKIEVYLKSSDSKPYSAEIIGYNISADLAVLKISAKNLNPVKIGSVKDLQVGQYVVTLGSPGGLDFMGSVTYGVISGLNRKISSDSQIPLIQTDAAINPGNSGGALLNTKGELIGINSSKIAATEYEGMGFAIPIDIVQSRCDKIIKNQGANEPYIGIAVSTTYNAETLKYYGYPVGAVVSSVAEGSPADKVGIRRGDIITEFDGKEITDPKYLSDYVSECSPGDQIKVKIYRSGRYYSVVLRVVSNG